MILPLAITAVLIFAAGVAVGATWMHRKWLKAIRSKIRKIESETYELKRSIKLAGVN